MKGSSAKMTTRGGGPAIVDRRLWLLAPIAPLFFILLFLIGKFAPPGWNHLAFIVVLIPVSALAWCLWTFYFVWRLARTAIRTGGMVCGNCGHVLRGSPGKVCPECGVERPSDSELRRAWWRWAPLFRPFRYSRWSVKGKLRRRLLLKPVPNAAVH
ncbi:MAG TPA: hypothetical protein VEB22_14945 [Phycisphaerales bacterium]|nr:hypothetical protein [Phycisphaerales bacterium]